MTQICVVLVGPRESNAHMASPTFLKLPTQWILDVLICNWLGAYLGGYWIASL